MEQLVLILIIALISFINWLIKKSAEAREKRKLERQAMEGGESLQGREEPEPAAKEQDPDDSMRRLMEALGLPQDEVPPPIPRREPVPPPIISPEPRMAPPPVPANRPAVAAKGKPSVPAAPKRPRSPLRELLASPEGLKKAVMLSEILGAPKSLRP